MSSGRYLSVCEICAKFHIISVYNFFPIVADSFDNFVNVIIFVSNRVINFIVVFVLFGVVSFNLCIINICHKGEISMSISENNLHFYFPMLRTRSQLLADIHASQSLAALFDSWIPEHQEDFLNFCTGVKGVKMTYDSFFKEILNPEYVPERLNDFLSVLLNQSVTVLSVLPNDSTRIATESSLLITDLVVQLEDGSIANIEIQKIGYHFPGERAACYSADLLLRQYKRVRDQQ